MDLLSSCTVLAACQRGLSMAEQDSTGKKLPAVAALHSHFIVGSVSEENSEDETAGKLDLQMEENPRSLSPSSVSSDSTYEMGFDSLDGPLHNLRSEMLVHSFAVIVTCMSTFTMSVSRLFCLVLEIRDVAFEKD